MKWILIPTSEQLGYPFASDIEAQNHFNGR